MAAALEDVLSLSFNEFRKHCKTFKKQKIGIIYSFKSPSGKMYIGQTTSNRFSKRMNDHKSVDTCRHFHNAIKKYGWDTIKKGFKLLAFTDDLESLNELEIKFIKQYDSFKNGYNCTEGGGGQRGFKHSLKARKKLSEAHKKRYKDPEAHKKLSEAMKIHWKDPEARKKHSESRNKYFKDNPDALRKQIERMKAFQASKAGKRAREKAHMACRKPIIATNLQTGESTQYASARDAERKLSALHKSRRKFNNSHISACALKKQKKHQGHAFAFA